MLSRSARTLLLITLGLSLAGCGHRPGDRALSGGLLGAGGGAALAAVTGGNLGSGALIGGALGAVGGAVTNPHAVNLGRPIWR